MLTPNGQPAETIEKVMLLSMWANTLNEEFKRSNQEVGKKMIFAGLGKPTYPVNPHTIESYLNYWKKKQELAEKWHIDPELESENSAVDYGEPCGDEEPRKMMAQAMSKWYDTEIRPEHVLFTVGGIGALRIIFDSLNTLYGEPYGYRIITPFPHYSAYSNSPHHHLHPVEVMEETGYQLTAAALEKSIKEAYQLGAIDKGMPRAVLICNPSNPLGTIIKKEELLKIAEVLRKYPDLNIIFDEAYAEMCFIEMPSFLQLAPDLKERTIILRSATKALSAAGERMAVVLAFNQSFLNEMTNKNISYFVHAPRSAQWAYAHTMMNFCNEAREKLSNYYKKKVEYVIERLEQMGASMPCASYAVEATFYALADFSDLIGLELPGSAARALKRSDEIRTGEDLAYFLLFNDALMVAPLSYFGLSETCGYLRITCSGRQEEMKEMMDRLEQRLFAARKTQNEKLLVALEEKLTILLGKDEVLHSRISNKIANLDKEVDTCLTLKMKNEVLRAYCTTILNESGNVNLDIQPLSNYSVDIERMDIN